MDLVYEVYPGATHTRFEHSIGVLHHGRNIFDNTERKGYEFGKSEKKTAQLACLLHDFGHSPYSHGVEFVLMDFGEPDHDKKTLERLEELETEIEEIPFVDYSLLTEIFERKNPLYKTIWNMVGADVLDYISRDANRCAVDITSDTNRIETYAYFDGQEYGIDSKARESVRAHINSNLVMFLEVYNRKSCSLSKGIIRRGVYEAIKEGKIKPEEIWPMTDGELEAALSSSGGIAEKMYKRIRNRGLPKAFLTIKLEGMGSQEEIRGKPIKVLESPENELMKLVKYFKDIDKVIEFEEQVEKELGLEPGDGTLADMPHLEMLAAEDTALHNKETGWTSLFKEISNVEDDFKLDLRRKYALRVGVVEEHRKKSFDQAQTIAEILESFA